MYKYFAIVEACGSVDITESCNQNSQQQVMNYINPFVIQNIQHNEIFYKALKTNMEKSYMY